MRKILIITVLATMLLSLAVACDVVGNEDMESKMSQQQSEIDALKGSVATLEQRIGEREASIAELEQRISEREASIAELEQRIGEQEARADEIESAVAGKLEDQLKEVIGQMASMSGMAVGSGAMGSMSTSAGPSRFDRETATPEQRALVEETLACAREMIEINKDMSAEVRKQALENIEDDVWSSAGVTEGDELLMQMKIMTCSQRDYLKSRQ